MNKLYITFLFTVITVLIHSQAVQTNLQAHYKFNSNLLDETSNNNDLQLDFGSASFGNIPPTGYKSMAFNGQTRLSSISIFNNSQFTETAIAVWVKSSTITSDLQTIVQGAYCGFGVYIEQNTGKLMGFYGSNSIYAYKSKQPITDGQWHHVTTQSDGTTTYVYIDGILDGSTTNDGYIVGNGSSNNILYLGRSNGNAYPFTGEIYDLRIYNRTLSQCEIDTLSNKNYNEGIVALYDFDNNLTDISINQNNLQVLSGPVAYELFYNNDSAIVFNGLTHLESSLVFNNSTFDQGAICLWVKSSTITSQLQTIVQGAYCGFGVYIEENTGKLMGFFGSNSVNAYKSVNPITDGQWHHVVSQSDGVKTYVYIDGILDGFTANDGFIVGNGGANNKIYMGKSNGSAYPFTGSVSRLKIFNRTLSDCEITERAKKDNKLVGLNEVIDNSLNYLVYPNPTNEKINIELAELSEDVIVSILSIEGKLILKESFGNTQKINLNLNAKAGAYILRITSDNKSSSKIIIKE